MLIVLPEIMDVEQIPTRRICRRKNNYGRKLKRIKYNLRLNTFKE